jgi:two-component system phosphate regulon sensor histidine kinase PhoR
MYTAVLLIFMVAGGFILQAKLRGTLREQLIQEVLTLTRVVQKNLPDTDDAAVLDSFCRTYQDLTGARVTVIRIDGSVIGESEPKALERKNHLDRPEVQGAVKTGLGIMLRRSDSLGVDMLYVASLLEEKGKIIRLAVPLTKVLMIERKVMIIVTLTLYLIPLGAITVCFFLVRRMAEKIKI